MTFEPEPSESAIIPLMRRLLEVREPAFFLGAGASLHARDAEVPDGAVPQRLPTAGELAARLCERVNVPYMNGHPNLIEISSYIEILGDRMYLEDALSKMLDDDYAPGRIHRFIARLERVRLIITTNYDRFIERAFDEIGRPYDLVVNTVISRSGRGDVVCVPADNRTARRMLESDSFDHTVIFKIHGSIGLPDPWDRAFVISEEDYYEMAGRERIGTLIPLQLRALLHKLRDLVFVGYGLGDIHIRHGVLGWRDRVHAQRGTRVSVVKTMSVFQREYWKRLGVEGVEMDTDEFVDAMSAHG